jgi:DNA-binding winged helix-turn-helix (wHTH) protein/predicted ATPase
MNEPRSREQDATAKEAQCLDFLPFRLDLVNHQLLRDGELISLKPKAFAVLRYLMEQAPRLVTKADLLRDIWSGVHVKDAVLKTQLSDIRSALGDEASTPRFIETAHGHGYRFIATVRKVVAPPVQKEAAPSAGTFVGREPELARLRRAFAVADAGRRQLVFVAGPAGIGKTSLLEAFCSEVGAQGGIRFARGQCVYQHGVGEAYLPLLEALARLGRTQEGSALVAVLRRHAPTWISQLPGLLLDGDDVPAPPTVGVTAAPERMLREMAEAVEALASDAPLVLLFEDVHWADPSTLAWMAYIARRPDPTRLLLLATYRPIELDASAHPLGPVKRELELQQRCQELALPSFARREVQAYLARRFVANRFPATLAELLVGRTGGSPLFLTKVLDSWIEQNLIRQDTDWQLSTAFDTLGAATPASIGSLIENEIERLTPAERRVLEAASVAGLEFSAASIAAALEQDAVATEEACLSLARRGQFIRSTGALEWPDGTVATRCEFIHELYRHTTYERIGAARRAQLHRRIGERQEAAHGNRARHVAVELALHFHRGGDRKKARFYWGAAGEQALSRSAYREAVDNFEQALALLRHVDNVRERLQLEVELQVAIGGALGMTLGHAAPEVERRYARARQLCQDLGETQRLTQTLPNILVFYLVRGDYRTVCQLGHASLGREARAYDDRAALEADVVVGISQSLLGDFTESRARLERASVSYESSRSAGGIQMLDTGALARTWAGVNLWMLGYPDQGLRVQLETLALAEQLQDPCTIAMISSTLTLLLQLCGDSRGVRERLDAAIAHCERHGFVYYLANLRVLGSVSAAVETGEWKERLTSITQAWQAVRATGSDFGDTRLCALVALAHARSGLEAEAFRLLERAFERVESNGERWWEPELHRTLGELVLETGLVPSSFGSRWQLSLTAPQFAEACFVRALEAARSMCARSLELRAAVALARCWHKRGRGQDAEQLLESVYRWFTEGFATRDLMDAQQLLRELAAKSNVPEVVPARHSPTQVRDR